MQSGIPIDLSPWSLVPLNTAGGESNPNWVLDSTHTTVTQTNNAQASIYLSDFTLANDHIDGGLSVLAGSGDNDYMGFVFGYQDSSHFYVFDWKEADKPDPFGFAAQGMTVKVVNSATPLTGPDLWPTVGNGTTVQQLYHNSIPWRELTNYQFSLDFQPGRFSIDVRQDGADIASFTVNDATYTSGKFGFYNFSQGQVQYSGFRHESLPARAYTYPVRAVSPPWAMP